MPIDQKNESLVKDTSNFYHPSDRKTELESHISFINNIDITNKKSNKKSNFLPKEWTKLRNLMNQPDTDRNANGNAVVATFNVVGLYTNI